MKDNDGDDKKVVDIKVLSETATLKIRGTDPEKLYEYPKLSFMNKDEVREKVKAIENEKAKIEKSKNKFIRQLSREDHYYIAAMKSLIAERKMTMPISAYDIQKISEQSIEIANRVMALADKKDV